MKALLAVLLLAGPAGGGVTPPRFSLDLVRADAGQLPALHSYGWAGSNGKWLVVGGRTNGLHLFVNSGGGGKTPPPNAFPPSNANRMVWVIDPAARRAWSAPVQNLPASIADHLSATNAQHFQDGNVLYLVGGYGLDSTSGQMTTLPYTTAVKVQETIDAVLNGQPLSPYLQQTRTYTDCPQFGTNTTSACLQQQTPQCKTGPGWEACMKKVQAQCAQNGSASQAKCMALAMSGSTSGFPTNDGYYARVTGGGLEKVGGVFYLVFGQLFEGLYSVDEGDYGKWPINQVYTQRVAALALKPEPLTASLLKVVQQDPNDDAMPYHRRDLNVFSTLSPADGSARVAAHGGVFVPGQDAAYRQPVFVEKEEDPNNVRVRVDGSYAQAMSQYDCATLRLFDRRGAGGDMSLAFFGGISLYYLDAKTGTLKSDSGLPFIDDLSVLTQHADGTWSEFVRRQPLDALLGTSGAFVPKEKLAASENGVVYLDALTTRTLVGYVYGGILASAPQTNGDPNLTRASNALYEVWLTPTPPPEEYWVPVTRTSRAAPPPPSR